MAASSGRGHPDNGSQSSRKQLDVVLHRHPLDKRGQINNTQSKAVLNKKDTSISRVHPKAEVSKYDLTGEVKPQAPTSKLLDIRKNLAAGSSHLE